MSGPYTDALQIAADRIETLGTNPEYERGMVNLLADLYPIHEMDTGERMEMIERDLRNALAPGYATELAHLAGIVARRYPDDDDAQRVAEYTAQVVADHEEPRTVTTNEVAHVLACMGYGDWSAEVLEGHAAEATWRLPEDSA